MLQISSAVTASIRKKNNLTNVGKIAKLRQNIKYTKGQITTKKKKKTKKQ